MLWYKAWLESRARFVLALGGSALPCWIFVLDNLKSSTTTFPGAPGLIGLINVGNTILAAAWILSVILLMMGGLLQEKASGLSSFTLSLPVSRSRLIFTRVSVGCVQAIVLILVPWTGMLIVAHVVGQPYPIGLALFHITLLLSGGSVFLAVAVLVSSIVQSPYTAPLVGISACSVVLYALRSERLANYNPWRFMTGWDYFKENAVVHIASFPLLQAFAFCGVASLLIIASTKLIQVRDF